MFNLPNVVPTKDLHTIVGDHKIKVVSLPTDD
jgi:hypothetical protein